MILAIEMIRHLCIIHGGAGNTFNLTSHFKALEDLLDLQQCAIKASGNGLLARVYSEAASMTKHLKQTGLSWDQIDTTYANMRGIMRIAGGNSAWAMEDDSFNFEHEADDDEMDYFEVGLA